MILKNFVIILNINAHKKNRANVSLIFFNCHNINLRGTLYYIIFKLFVQVNNFYLYLIFIEKNFSNFKYL